VTDVDTQEEIQLLKQAISLLKKSKSGTIQQAIRDIKARIRFLTNPRRERFQQFCSTVMKNYESRGKWSSSELVVKEILDGMGLVLGANYYHNYKLQNESQTGYYSLDFILPEHKIVLECDPKLWHGKMGRKVEADKKRDVWLRRLGFTTYRLRSLLKNKHALRMFIELLIRR